MRPAVAVALAVLLGSACARPAPPPSPPPPDEPTACAEPRPGPDAVCVQDCGPPVVREGDPPPPWRWLSPEEAARRAQTGCPRCLPADAAIATPSGPIAVSALRAGDLVWSVDRAGARIAVPVLRTQGTPAPAAHTLVVLVLSDGREVTASAGHPALDGRALGALAPGDPLDGARVIAVRRRPYGGERTHDLLPAGPTGAYWADGVLISSTLR